MKRFFSLGSLLALLAIAVIFATVPGCPEKKPVTVPPVTDGDKKGGDGGDKKAVALVAKAYDGVVKGKVELEGTVPEPADLKMAGHADKDKCEAGPHKEQTWIVGKGNGVANVVVFLEPTGGKFFAVDEKLAKEYKQDPTIDQPYCVYEPHVVAMFAAYKTEDGKSHETGQKLLVKNSGGISHNTKTKGEERANPEISKNIATDNKVGEPYPIKYQKTPINIACDKHNWMNAKLLTFDHPFFAVTDKDGNFEIQNVPTGVEVTVKVWHEVGTGKSEQKTFSKGDNALSLKIKDAPK